MFGVFTLAFISLEQEKLLLAIGGNHSFIQAVENISDTPAPYDIQAAKVFLAEIDLSDIAGLLPATVNFSIYADVLLSTLNNTEKQGIAAAILNLTTDMKETHIWTGFSKYIKERSQNGHSDITYEANIPLPPDHDKQIQPPRRRPGLGGMMPRMENIGYPTLHWPWDFFREENTEVHPWGGLFQPVEVRNIADPWGGWIPKTGTRNDRPPLKQWGGWFLEDSTEPALVLKGLVNSPSEPYYDIQQPVQPVLDTRTSHWGWPWDPETNIGVDPHSGWPLEKNIGVDPHWGWPLEKNIGEHHIGWPLQRNEPIDSYWR